MYGTYANIGGILMVNVTTKMAYDWIRHGYHHALLRLAPTGSSREMSSVETMLPSWGHGVGTSELLGSPKNNAEIIPSHSSKRKNCRM